jgi:prepilin-type processing-associated H-X9-DG protein
MILKMRYVPDPLSRELRPCHGFTRVDLIATVLMLMSLSLLTFPRFARGSIATLEAACVENQRQICSAWQQYAADHSDRLVNNFIIPDTLYTINTGQFDNWALNIVDWSTKSDNTNLTYVQNSKLFPYLQGNTLAFKCPADSYLSSPQQAAQWTGRVRSYSMNVFMGKTGLSDSATNNGQSIWVSGKRQFLKTSSIPNPANTLVFLDEHPDSINDGFFFENPSQLQWGDLPASYHNGGCGFGFADGHGEIHTWIYNATKVPVRYGFFTTPGVLPSGAADYLWLATRMTVDQTALAMNRRTNAVEIAWSALPTNYVLEATSDLSTLSWTPVDPKPTADYGTKSVTTGLSNSFSFFRLRRY